MKKINKKEKQIAIYQTKAGAIELKSDLKKDTIWASLDQIAQVFERDKSVISRHIKNIFKDEELKHGSVVAFFATTATDGKVYNVEYFNLDVILSVGYRVNSKKATLFRQWATKTLRSFIVDGYAINRSRIAVNYNSFLKAVDDVKALLPAGTEIDNKNVLELITLFSETWLSLDAYDKDSMVKIGTTKKKIILTAGKLYEALKNFKLALVKKGEAGDLFGAERQKDSVAGIIGNVMQSFGGQPVYPSVEEKAANLLYFMVKNHPFIDGNKRSGAYAFIWFLQKTGILNSAKITPPALTALTLLVAESNPKNKERMIQLILQLLKK
ncbi:MAG: virulence protein RhuM/Fic/DOC family protein [Patescibacteria group bacterium]|jgi:prophage maintenance system killer protein